MRSLEIGRKKRLAPSEACDERERALFEQNRCKNVFFNPWGVTPCPGVRDFLRWKRQPNPFAMQKRRPHRAKVASDPKAGWEAMSGSCRLMWLGHATVFFELDGVSLITDPIFGSVGRLASRRAPFPLPLEALPQADVVLISHGHLDHLDVPSLTALCRSAAGAPLVVVPRGLSAVLPRCCRTVLELDWWDQITVGPLRVTLVPAQHWHQRNPLDINKRLWGAFVVEGNRRLFFCGDSGYFNGFSVLGRLFDGFDLAMLPLGGFEPRWLMAPQHLNPRESVQAMGDLRARHFLGIHWGTFDLADEPIWHGVHLLQRIVAQRGLDPRRFHVLPHGGCLGLEADSVRSAS
jgi:L-ascorbate metabolism protein UlaG (beta-lactamase superfamily)